MLFVSINPGYNGLIRIEPIFQLETFDLGEMSLVVGHKYCIGYQGMGSNHRIGKTDRFASSEQCHLRSGKLVRTLSCPVRHIIKTITYLIDTIVVTRRSDPLSTKA